MNALSLISDLKRQGVQFRWGAAGVSVSGDLGRLTPDYKRAIAEREKEFTAQIKWQTLQDEAETTYGGDCSRFYPFIALNLEDCIPLRSTIGEVRIAQVMPDFLRVVRECDMKEWERECAVKGKRLPYPTPMIRMEFHQVSPPVDEPGQPPNDLGTLDF